MVGCGKGRINGWDAKVSLLGGIINDFKLELIKIVKFNWKKNLLEILKICWKYWKFVKNI